MFERYTDPARRALFFARYAVARMGGETIEPEHLLIGLQPRGLVHLEDPADEEALATEFLAQAQPEATSASILLEAAGIDGAAIAREIEAQTKEGAAVG